MKLVVVCDNAAEVEIPVTLTARPKEEKSTLE
jgi:hypothetical protein